MLRQKLATLLMLELDRRTEADWQIMYTDLKFPGVSILEYLKWAVNKEL
jgi:hypothetical protein